MLHPNTLSPKPKDRSSRGNTPTDTMLPISSKNLSELSEVPCYTCRRRHVKCDRSLPACAKCAKKGVQCLGYQKPLRWAEGVAVRGKLKGKAQPVIESQAQSSLLSPMRESEYLGSQSTQEVQSDVPLSEAAVSELMTYHNTVICSEASIDGQPAFIHRSVAPLSPENIQKIPKEMLNCILGISAVHMAMRHPESRANYRLALETKAEVYGRLNDLLRNPPKQRPDMMYCYSLLLWAMDIFENGLTRWRMHLNGCKEIISFLGGNEAIVERYPYLYSCLFHYAHFETMLIASSYLPLTMRKMTTRKAMETFTQETHIKASFFNPCPSKLTLVFHDLGSTAASLLGGQIENVPQDLVRREAILLDTLRFQEAQWIEELHAHYEELVATPLQVQNWTLAATAWKNATIILVLRHLFYGRADTTSSGYPEVPAETFPKVSPYPSPYQQTEAIEYPFQSSSNDPSAGRSSLTVQGSHHARSSPSSMSNLYVNRYRIHNEAFNALASTLSALSESIEPSALRYLLLPIIILAFVTSPGSNERELCKLLIARFKDTFSTPLPAFAEPSYASQSRESSPMPPISSELDLEIPWFDLDNFSAMVENSNPQSSASREELVHGAVEWNWWDMLHHLKLDMAWPATAGTSHLETNTEFWAYQILSSVVTEEAFESWSQD